MYSLYIIPAFMLFAGFVRGYTGFGFSAIVILVLTVQYPVSETVPAVLLTDLIACAPLYYASWKKTDRAILVKLLIATAIGIPMGLAILHWLPNLWLKVLVPSAILAMAFLPRCRNRFAQAALNSRWFAGIMSGWTTSAVSAGGAPVIIHLRNSELPIEAQRNTLISYFALTILLTIGMNFLFSQQFQMLPERPLLLTGLALGGVMLGKALFQQIKLPLIHHGSYYLMLLMSAWSLIVALIAIIY